MGVATEVALNRRFEAAVFDWDGTAVPDREAPAGPLRRVIERLCERGFDVGVVSGTHVDNVDGQLLARPTGPGCLYLCLNRGSEVFAVGPDGPRLLHRRVASPEEEAALTAAAELTVERLAVKGLHAEIVARRLNRRKIDLISEPEWADPSKGRIAELLEAVETRLRRCGIADLSEIVEVARTAATEAGLADARVTSDAKHVEIGLTDKSDSARWLLERLWRRGIGPRGVLIAGDELGPLGGVPGSDSLMLVPEASRAVVVSVGVEPLGVPDGVLALGGGPGRFLGLLEDQLARREQRALPLVAAESGWTLAVEGLDPELERAQAALLTLADGRIGTSGCPVAAHRAAVPRVLAADLYAGEGAETMLVPCPAWNLLECELDSGGISRAFDLRAGVLRQEIQLGDRGPLSVILFSSLARPGTAVLRAEGSTQLLEGGTPLVATEPEVTELGRQGRFTLARVGAGTGGVAAAALEERLEWEAFSRIDRLAVYRADPVRLPGLDAALADLVEADRAGFDRLLVEHRCAWARRWEDADVVIEGDPELQLAVRFALFHLMASVADSGEAAVGARGLSGPAYRGHVFWDSEIFILPFLAATHPEAARAMLEYRLRRLPAARAAAQAQGRAGARFPWESAAVGADVTPPSAHDRTGRPIPIRTGELEEHIVADVAWAAACYADWSGDRDFLEGVGRPLLVETARYWASRLRVDGAGRGHIYGVIGPDEYHEPVDDNAYTNVMARWNLRRAAELVGAAPGGVTSDERESWLRAAGSLVDGYHPESGLYEQFAGFWELEPLMIEDVAPRRPVAAEILLGRERLRRAQVVKQADVLMLHHLVPDEVAPGSLLSNLLFYEPRTAHGSSLSPGIHAALFARAGRPDRAVERLRIASRIDLDDLTGTTAEGLHLAAMGSVWQALAFGFAGLRPTPEALQVDPRLPAEWTAMELCVRFRGSRVCLRVEPSTLTVTADPETAVFVVGTARPIVVQPSGARLERRGESWEVAR